MKNTATLVFKTMCGAYKVSTAFNHGDEMATLSLLRCNYSAQGDAQYLVSLGDIDMLHSTPARSTPLLPRNRARTYFDIEDLIDDEKPENGYLYVDGKWQAGLLGD